MQEFGRLAAPEKSPQQSRPPVLMRLGVRI
jgi:hypothetical protein